jgi:hypothetical protein
MLSKFQEFLKSKNYLEMAVPGTGSDLGDVVKKPLLIDKEDIDFLQQFPHDLWNKALHKRYEMLFDALKDLHQERMNQDPARLKNKIHHVIKSIKAGEGEGAWSFLEKDLPPETLNRLKNKFTAEKISGISDKDLENEADTEAFEHIKAGTERIPGSNEPIEFNLGKKGSASYMAKPYLNRLYHKLERTHDLPHHPESELSPFGIKKGQYGFDLAYPQDSMGKKTTRGIQSWPSTERNVGDTGQRIMDNLYNLNQHEIFGKLPPGTHWIQAKRDGSPVKDKWIVKQLELDYYKKIYPLIKDKQIDDPLVKDVDFKNLATESQVRAEAKRLAEKYVVEDIKQGKLKAPAIPGHPEIDRHVRYIDGQIHLPDVWLPAVKQKVTKMVDGKPQEEIVDKPLVNPTHFFRPLGTHEEDFETDEEGKKTKNYDLGNLADKGLGSPDEKGLPRYVRVDPEEYKKSGDKGHQAPTAFHLNQNTRGRSFITAGSEDYSDAYESVFGKMKLLHVDGYDLYDDIWNGIRKCLGSARCGGAGPIERAAMKSEIPSLHGVVVSEFQKDLRRPDLLTKKGRESRSYAIISPFAQYDLGNRTRRQRIIDQLKRDISRNTTAAGKSGDSLEIGDALDAQRADKNIGNVAGSKRLVRGSLSQELTLDVMRSLLRDLDEKAKRADQDSEEGKALMANIKNMVNQAISPEQEEMIKKGLRAKTDLMTQFAYILAQIWVQTGVMDEVGAHKDAEELVSSWVGERTTAEDLMKKFMSYETIRNYADRQTNVDQNLDLQKSLDIKKKMDEDDEVINFKKYVMNHPDAFAKFVLPKDGEKYGILVKNWTKENEIKYPIDDHVKSYLQRSLEQELSPGGSKIQPVENPVPKNIPFPTTNAEPENKQVAREMGGRMFRNPQSSSLPFGDVHKSKNFLDILHHPDFEKRKFQVFPSPKMAHNKIEELKRLKDEGRISQQDYDTSVAKIKSLFNLG